MASCREICNTALRKIGTLGAGREPRVADATDALDGLKALYRTLITSGAFGRLQDVVPTANYTARENQRVFRLHDPTLIIKLPDLVSRDAVNPRPYDQENDQYPAVLTDRNSRPPMDCAIVVIVDAFTGITGEWIYDGHTKEWRSIYDLTTDDVAPLSFRDELGLASMLAMSIVDQFNGELGQTTVVAARLFQSGLVNRWSMTAIQTPGVYC